jgi:hypothetical protein
MREYPTPPKEVVPEVGHSARENNVIRVISTIGFTIGFIVTCGYFILALIFNGGINGLISNLKPEPNPNSSAINAKREVVTEEINQSFDELQNILHYNYYETATHDYCSRGDNNYKRSDGYAYRCSLRITKFYGFNGDFRQQMFNFEQKIISIGWNPPSYRPDNPCEKMLEEYYAPYPGKLVSDLPGRHCSYEKGSLSLELEFAEKETRSFILQNAVQKVSGRSYDGIYDEKNFQDSSLVTKMITDTDRFVLIISIQKKYFQN